MAGPIFGSGLQLTVADSAWTSEGSLPLDYFGQYVNPAGDVNGDDYEDFIVGSQFANGWNGRAWLFYGGPDGPDGTPSVTFDPPMAGSNLFFGMHASTAGDLNGDGYDDIMIGCSNCEDYATGGSADEGMVFFYYGADGGIDTTYDWRARGIVLYSHLGWAAGPAGDVNGDGYDDVLVGAYCYDLCGGGEVHHAYLFFGSAGGLGLGGARPEGTPSNCDWSVAGEQYREAFATVLGTAGDLNGDGYDEIFVGAQGWDGAVPDVGKIWVWHGSGSGPTAPGSTATADWSSAGTNQDDRYGGAAGYDGATAGAGDVNGDGYDDFLIGCYGCDAGVTNNGSVQLWYGSEGGLSPGAPDWTAVGLQESDVVGFAVTPAGDFNNDGYDDFLVSQHGWDRVWDPPNHTNEGRVMLWLGSSHGPLDQPLPIYADCLMSGDQNLGNLGFSLAGAADTDGDGFDDLLLGAQYYDTDGDTDMTDNQGKVFGFMGLPLISADDFESGDALRWSLTRP